MGTVWSDQLFVSMVATQETSFLYFFSKEKLLGRAHHLTLFR